MRDRDVAEILAAMLDEVRALREEVGRQSELLEAILRRLESIERTQSS